MRAKRGSLSKEVIVEAATRIVNVGGIESLTMARLGKEIGADPTAVYRYYFDKDALVLDVLDRFVASILADFRSGDSWEQNLIDLHLLFRERFLTHPGIARSLAEAEESPPAAHRAAGYVIGQLESAGLRGLQLTNYYRIFTSLMFGASLMDGSTVGDAQWVAWSKFFRYIDEFRPPAEIRTVEGARAEAEQAYRVGLAAIVASVKATVALGH